METKLELTFKTSVKVNLDALDIRVEDIDRFLDLRMRDPEQFEVVSMTRSADKMLHDAIESAIREQHHRRYPGYITIDTDGGQIETARWTLTAAKIIRRISCRFYCWAAKII